MFMINYHMIIRLQFGLSPIYDLKTACSNNYTKLKNVLSF